MTFSPIFIDILFSSPARLMVSITSSPFLRARTSVCNCSMLTICWSLSIAITSYCLSPASFAGLSGITSPTSTPKPGGKPAWAQTSGDMGRIAMPMKGVGLPSGLRACSRWPGAPPGGGPRRCRGLSPSGFRSPGPRGGGASAGLMVSAAGLDSCVCAHSGQRATAPAAAISVVRFGFINRWVLELRGWNGKTKRRIIGTRPAAPRCLREGARRRSWPHRADRPTRGARATPRGDGARGVAGR